MPNTNHDFFTFSELYRRKQAKPTPNNSDPDHLWEVDSDIGKILPESWQRQLTEFDFCYTQPDHQYLANGVNFFGEDIGYQFSPILAKTSVGGLSQGQYYLNDAYELRTIPSSNGTFPLISGIAVHPVDPNKVWVSLIGYDNIDVRVAFSSDGGMTWVNADPNASLPNLPVNNIVYQYGSNDVLYIGTDVGIYFKDASMTNWEHYGEFPNVRVTELKINYCQNKLRAATFGRSIWEADLLPTVNTLFFEINSGEDIVWENDKALHTSLKIMSGGKLTVKGFLSMPANSKIIIEEGAVLTIDDGIVTNKCGQPWQGIQVWGHRDSTQYTIPGQTCPQGKLILKNGAIIENAITAVDLWNPNDYTTTGGIVLAEDAIFRNNTRAVHALNYRNFDPFNPNTEVDNLSYFNSCTFEITPDYLAVDTFYKHADLSKVKGIRFSGCDFTLSPDANGVSEYNQGIASYSAGFWVDALCTSQQLPCTAYDSCHFNGFYSGIYATKDEFATSTFYVNRARFKGNAHGIKVYGVTNQTILNSDFEIGYNDSNDSTFCTPPPAYGIFMEGSSGFAIEENWFTKDAGSPISKYTGIYVRNTGQADEIYRNDFSGLSYGNYSSGINHESQINFGLSYFCNTNTNNYADFYVENVNPSGIQSLQGDLTHATGNTFSPTGAVWHFYNGGDYPVHYYYCALCQNQNPQSLKTYNIIKHAINESNTCLSHYGGEGDKSILLSEQQKIEHELLFADALSNYNGVKALYDNLKDGGSTQSTLSDIQAALPQDMWQLRSSLLGISPHLSEEVLKQVADKTDVFTEAAIFDILAANPDELRNEELLVYLENKQNPLPGYMIEILRQVATGTTYKTVLQQEMARHNQDKTRAANDMIRSYLNDTVINLVQLRNWLDNRGGIESDKQIIGTYLQEDNYTDALYLANLLPTLYNLQGEELAEHSRSMQLLGLQQNLHNENRQIDSLNANEIEALVMIADSSHGTAGATAKGILETYYGGHYCNCLVADNGESYKSGNVDPNTIGKIYGLNITAKPNPAKDWAAFDYTLPENATTATLLITDATGKTVETFILNGQQGQKLWDIRNTEPGTYLYTLMVAGYSSSGKIVINQ